MTTTHTVEIRAKNLTDRVFVDLRKNFEGIEKRAREVGTKIAAAWKSLPLPMKLLAGAVAAATLAMVKLVKVALEASARIDKLAKSIRAAGIQSEAGNRAYQTMLTFLERAGVSAQQYQQSLRTINLRVSEAVNGNKQYVDILTKAGIAYKDMNGNALESIDVLGQMIVKFTEGQISLAEFSKLAGEEAGPNIAQAFSNIEGGLNGFLEAMDRAGKETAYVSLVTQGVNEDWEDLKDSFARRGQAIANSINGFIIPPLLWVGEKLLKLVDFLRLVGQITAEVFGAMKDIFMGMVGILDGVSEGIASAFLWAWGKTLEGFGELLTGMSDAWNQSGFAKLLSEIGLDVSLDFGSGIAGAGDALLSRAAESQAAAAASLNSGLSGIAGGIGRVSGLGQFIEDTKVVNDGFDSILKSMKEIEEENKKISESLTGGGSGGVSSVSDSLAEADVAAQGLKDTMVSVGERFADSIASALEDGKLEWKEFKDIALNALGDILSYWLSNSDIFGGIFNGMKTGGGAGGFLSGVGESIGSALAGIMFADGGFIGAGKMGIVGEAGPELVRGPAMVHSNSDTKDMLGGGGGPVTVNFNINAIDSRTGTEFIMENKNMIVGVINQAMNKRGQSGIVR